jgi:large exoprotein involved in heme utilization and adhesion
MAAAGALPRLDHWHLHPNDAQIVAWTGGPGKAGDVTISIPEIQAHLNSQIVSYTFGSGDAGTITINADRVRLVDTSAIVTSTEQSTGSAGRIVLNIGERFEMSERGSTDGRYQGLRLTARGGVLSTSAGHGDAGSVVLRAPEVILDDARIQTSTVQAGQGGRVEIYAGDLFLRNGGQIDVKSLAGSTGDAGAIVVEAANRFEITGISAVDTGFSGVNAETLGTGRGGNVRISAGTLLVDRGFIRSSTGGSGDAGTVEVGARDVLLVNGGSIDAGTAAGSSGAGGSVSVVATGAITVRGLDTSASSPALVLHDNPLFGGFFTAGRPQGIVPSTVSSNTAGSGAGGSVTLSAPSIRIEDGARVSATSAGVGNAGSISITAADALRIFGGSTISSEALRADGGNIDIRVGNLVHLKGSEITTAVGSGLGSGGNIFIDPTFVILENSKIAANAFGGSGGNIRIIATYFLNTLDTLVDASSQLGVPGTVQISSPNTNLSTQLKVLPAAFFDATQLVREACAGRGVASGSGGSSLVGVGRGGLAASPERLATSTYFGDAPSAVSSAPTATGLKLTSATRARLAVDCTG